MFKMLEFFNSKLLLLIALFGTFFLYLKLHVYNYWKKCKVPHDTPSIPLGDLNISYFTGEKSLGALLKESYNKYKRHRFHGMYFLHQPILMINDPELVKLILSKEFLRFEERGFFAPEEIDELSSNLFFQSYSKWKRLRKVFTHAFTTVNMKEMFTLMNEVLEEMVNTCDEILKDTNEIDIMNIVLRCTGDSLSSLVYGLKINSLNNPNHEMLQKGIEAVHMGRFQILMGIFFRDILKKFNPPFFSKEIQQFFSKVFINIKNSRRGNKVNRKDFMHLLLQQIDEVADNKITMSEAISSAFTFFVGGFETSSLAVTYTLLELAANQEIQEKLYKEIEEVKRTTGFTYDSIMGMKYLNMVFFEALRKHPGGVLVNRICVEDMPIPDSNYVIPKGMRVVVSVLGMHHDPKYFPNPDEFDPNRYSEENASNRSPFISLGFGGGPRQCIGKKFGLMQSKQLIVTLLSNYKFYVSPKTSLPIQLSSETFITIPKHTIYLLFARRTA